MAPKWNGPIAMVVAMLATAVYMQVDPGWHALDGFEWCGGAIWAALSR